MAEVKLSQESYDALLDDIERLRERNAELERKLDKEVKLSYEIEGNLYDVSKERDELINDMQNVKRKAQAFDEILEIAEEDCWAEEFAAYVSQIIDNYKEEQ